jgi:hypothetical protein
LPAGASTLGAELVDTVAAVVAAVAAREADSSQLERDYEAAIEREQSVRELNS